MGHGRSHSVNNRTPIVLQSHSGVILSRLLVYHDYFWYWTNNTPDNWKFITRFCFLTNKGALSYEFRYPVGYGTQEILLYYDDPGQWDSIYKRGKTCDQKMSVLSIASNQIIALNTSNTQTSTFSGCSLVNQDGDIWYHCQGERSFRSSRERWWYIAVARCGDPKDAVSGLYLKYKIHMTNGDDLLHEEYSADEFYILPVDIVFFIIYLVMCTLSVVCAVVLRSKQLFHTTYKLYLTAVFLWTLHLLIMVIAWGYYGDSGWEISPVEVTGRILQAASTIIFILMLILMAKGYTITRGRLSKTSMIKITIFMNAYIVIIIALFIWEGLFFDPGKVLYYYESPPGYGMIAMHLIGWLWFLYATVFTLKHTTTKTVFYIPFFAFFTIWFWAGPIVILIAMFVMAKWSREKTVNGVEQFVAFWGHVFFLILTRPSAANSNFPYHVRTSQIDTLATDDDETNRSGNPYILSSGDAFRGSGPNLEFFITHKAEGDAPDDESGRMFGPLDADTLRAHDIEPPSYSQAVNSGKPLPPIAERVGDGCSDTNDYFSINNNQLFSESIRMMRQLGSTTSQDSQPLPSAGLSNLGPLPGIGIPYAQERTTLPPIRGSGLPPLLPSAPPESQGPSHVSSPPPPQQSGPSPRNVEIFQVHKY